MEIGIGLPNCIRGVDGRTVVSWARRADEAGFSSLATIGRVAFPTYECLVTLAAAAGATERIRLFTNLLLAPTRDPVLLAKETASLDQLSGGRLVLGLGVGGRPDDYAVLGRDMRTRGKAFDSMLATLGSIWGGTPPEGTDQEIAPRPVRRGGIPILIGGMSDAAVRRTVEFGTGWTAGGAPPEQVAPFAERVRAAWADAGKPNPPRIVALTYFSIDHEDESRRNLLDYYAFLGDFADMIASSPPRTAADIRARVKAFEDIGVDELILDPSVPDIEQVDRLAEIVL